MITRLAVAAATVLVASLLVATGGSAASAAGTGAITGTVTKSDTSGLIPGARVVLYKQGAPYNTYYSETETNGSGVYSFSALPAGNYTLAFGNGDQADYLGEWWDSKYTELSAVLFAVADGVTTTKNAVLQRGVVITGNVKGDASPDVNVMGISVSAYTTLGGSAVATGATDAAGNYRLPGLPAGTYYVRFNSTNINWGAEWYPGSSSFLNAVPVVGSLSTTYTRNAVLDAATHFTGYVRDAAGNPISGVTVILYDSNQSSAGVVSTWVTQSGGSFLFNYLPNDDFNIAFVKKATGAVTPTGPAASEGGYITQWYDKSYSFDSSLRYAGSTSSYPSLTIVLENPFFADAQDPSSPFYTAIEWMASEGISTGTPAGGGGDPLYNPAATVSRQSMATFLYRLSGDTFTPPAEATFADVPSSASTYTAVEWMAAENISTGTPQPSGKPLFKPADAVSRSAMAAFLIRMSHTVYVPGASPSFADVPVGAANYGAIEWMKATGISTGTAQPSGLPLYKPADPVSRQAMALFLYRYAHLI